MPISASVTRILFMIYIYLTFLRLDMQYQVFRPGSHPDLRPPDSKAGTYIVLRVSALMMAPGFFVQGIGNPGKGPYLAAVGVSAELEIDTGGFCLLQMVGLMVKDDGKTLQAFCERSQIRP